MDVKLLWNERYGQHKFAYGQEPNDFIKENIGKLMPGPVLSLGEGDGRNAIYLARQSFSVHAVDLSDVGLAHLQQVAIQEKLPITTEVSDVAEFHYSQQQWANVISVWCHTPRAVRRKMHAGVVNCLQPGGAFLLEAYTPDQLKFKTGGPPVEELLMTVADLKEELAGLDFEIAHEIERDIQEGQFHHGQSAVVQICARKPAK